MQLGITREILHMLEIAQDDRPLTSDEDWLQKGAKKSCLVLDSMEHTMAHLRSRIHFLKDGDANTTLFHRTAGFRKIKNIIPNLLHEDRAITNQEEKLGVMFDFFFQ